MHLSKQCKVSDIVSFGTYPSSLIKDNELINNLNNEPFNQYGVGVFNGQKYLKIGDAYYLFEPIDWIVLEKKQGCVFRLISKNIIDLCFRRIDNKDYKNFLNAVFPNRAFTEKERASLQLIVHKPSNSSSSNNELYNLVVFPSAAVAQKLADSPMVLSDFVKRFTIDGPSSYHLFEEVSGFLGGAFGKIFDIQKKEVVLETNLQFPLGVRPVIEVKVE